MEEKGGKVIRIEIVKRTDLPIKEINMDFLQEVVSFLNKNPVASFVVGGMFSNKIVEVSYDIKILFGGEENPTKFKVEGKNAFLIKSEK